MPPDTGIGSSPDRVAAAAAIAEGRKAAPTGPPDFDVLRVLESVGVGFGVADTATHRLIYANPAYRAILGVSAAEIEGRTYDDFTHPDDRAEDDAQMRRLVAGEIPGFTIEKRYRRPDGETIWARLTVSPLWGPGEAPSRHIGVIEDVTDRRRTEEALRRQTHFNELVIRNAAEGLSVCHNIDEHPYVRFTVWNDRMTELTGYTIDEINRLGWYQTMYPDEETRDRAIGRMNAMRSGRNLVAEPWALTTREGTVRTVEISTSILEVAGDRTYVLALMQDVSDRIAAEQRQSRLVAELDHRVKNVLASVLSLAQQTIARSGSLEEFERSFSGRLRSMARTHETLAAARWGPVDLAGIVELALAPHGEAGRVRAEGPTVALPASATMPLGLTLHELATNAVKYGALSTASGTISIAWSVDRGELSLRWSESGGPPLPRNPAPGFGTSLIQGFVAHELGGRVRVHYAPEGLRAEIALPLERG